MNRSLGWKKLNAKHLLESVAFYSTRTLGLKQRLHMLSIYWPFTKRAHGILFSWGGSLGREITTF